jgi:hypothetical protein
MQRKVDFVEAHADRGNHLLKGMGGIFSSIRNKFSKKPDTPAEVSARNEAVREEAAKSRRNHRTGAGEVSANPHNDVSHQVVSTKEMGSEEALEDELLDQLSHSVSRVKAVAVAMGDELDEQDARLDELDHSVERASRKVAKAAATAKKLAS